MKSLNLPRIETSAKTNQTVVKVNTEFQEILDLFKRRGILFED